VVLKKLQKKQKNCELVINIYALYFATIIQSSFDYCKEARRGQVGLAVEKGLLALCLAHWGIVNLPFFFPLPRSES